MFYNLKYRRGRIVVVIVFKSFSKNFRGYYLWKLTYLTAFLIIYLFFLFLFSETDNMLNSRDAQMRRMAVLNLSASKYASFVDYSYDTEKELWCDLTLAFSTDQKNVDMSNVIRRAAEKAVIREVKNISRAFLIENLKGEKVLTTEGANIEAMFAYEKILDLRRLHCNNIHDMARFYGIEAANKTIVKEIVNVFSVYGIDINPRHLSLIGKYI